MANNKNTRITSKDVENDIFCEIFKNDKERIRWIKEHHSDLSLVDSFSSYYPDLKLSQEVKNNQSINSVLNFKVKDVWIGDVVEFNKNSCILEVPGVKIKIKSFENFENYYDSMNNYLLTHNNKLWFEVKAVDKDLITVSIINGFYAKWLEYINKCSVKDETIDVHIDGLVNGGYICHTPITFLNDLTGMNFTHTVFIPGSHIVLNIERNFERWIGEDVSIVPQKIVTYRKNRRTGEIENSIVGSRKRVLQINGLHNLMDIYNKWRLTQVSGVNNKWSTKFEGTVTGIINSNNKTGIFVELDNMYVTGLMPTDSSELLDYKPGDKITVTIQSFEQQEGKDPFIYNKKNQLVKAWVRPVFDLA